MHVFRRSDHTSRLFLARTIAAQLHGLGFLLMLFGGSVLLPLAMKAGTAHFLACAAFVFTGAMVFLISSTYHFLYDGYTISPELALFLEDFDHFGIYLFIAGTYTPFLLNTVKPPWLGSLLIGVWTIAILGIVYTRVKPHLPRIFQSRAVYTSLFVVMGWLLLIRAQEIFNALNGTQIFLLLGGAAAYSVGAVVYATKRPRFLTGRFGYHEVWHLTVVIGATFHYVFILSFYWAR